MEIQIDAHTLERAQERGTDEREIRDVLETGFSIPAKHGRQGKAKVYDFGDEWAGERYQQKRVEVIYKLEGPRAVTITVYVFYGFWEEGS